MPPADRSHHACHVALVMLIAVRTTIKDVLPCDGKRDALGQEQGRKEDSRHKTEIDNY
jgi:hypothetical protein